MSNDANGFTIVDKNGVAYTSITDGSANRLQVQTQGDSSVLVTAANNIRTLLLNGTASSFLVNGSATNQTFKFSANATRGIIITDIMTVLSAAQLTTNGGYIGVSSTKLTNGITYQVTQSGTTNIIGTVKINEDFLALSEDTECLNVSGPYAFGAVHCRQYMPLAAGSTDNVSVVVKDNLANAQFSYLVAYAIGYYTS